MNIGPYDDEWLNDEGYLQAVHKIILLNNRITTTQVGETKTVLRCVLCDVTSVLRQSGFIVILNFWVYTTQGFRSLNCIKKIYFSNIMFS